MSIEIRNATSAEMKKNINIVKKMSGGMGFDENMGKVKWSSVRRISNFGYMFMPKDRGAKFEKRKINGVKTIIVYPKKQLCEHIIMYIHGGGFVSGSAGSSKAYCSMLANRSGCRIIAVDYSLAPEKPYPYGVNDCFDAYKGIIKEFPSAKIGLIGESAGANLCLVTALKAIKAKIVKPSSVIVHSPFVDFCDTLDRSQHKIDDFTVKRGSLKALNSIYVSEADPKNTELSPIYADFREFPPIFITCDYNETLFADSIELYKKCKSANVDVRMIQMKNSFHAFAATGTGTPETNKILDENIEFLKSNFDR